MGKIDKDYSSVKPLLKGKYDNYYHQNRHRGYDLSRNENHAAIQIGSYNTLHQNTVETTMKHIDEHPSPLHEPL